LHATELLKHNCSPRMEALLNHDSALTEPKPFLAGHSAAVTVFQIRQTVLWPRRSALGLARRSHPRTQPFCAQRWRLVAPRSLPYPGSPPCVVPVLSPVLFLVLQ